MAVNTYILSLRSNLDLYQSELDELRLLLSQRVLSALEYRAAERLIQLLLVSCISVAKHWAKVITGDCPKDAYQAFECLNEKKSRGNASPILSLDYWGKLIELRGNLIFQAQDLDPKIIPNMIAQNETEALFNFIHQGINWLAQQEKQAL
ncbi:HepT-like ribonuclease domain-containing protein [Shewanella mangrovisoli]|uniref:HepT-like ribonuclease domain-containing protein n=1 Tax=Shewanella mangrovisoli TaxID=2864211 RepID=UPI0035B7EA1F